MRGKGRKSGRWERGSEGWKVERGGSRWGGGVYSLFCFVFWGVVFLVFGCFLGVFFGIMVLGGFLGI